MAVSVINQWPISQINAYAPQVSSVSNTTTNTLVAVIGWTANNYTNTVNPISFVSDDAHNFWQHLATSQAATTIGAASRCSIWLCPNATAAKVLSVACASYVLGLTAEIFEVPGLPALAYADSVASNYNAFTSSLTVSGLNITSGDTLFAVAHVPNTIPGMTTPALWTALNSVTAYDAGYGLGGPNDSALYPYWTTAGSTGPISVTFATTPTMSVPMSAVAVSISSTGQSYTLQRPNRPILKVEAAFTSSPAQYTQVPVYSDITQYAVNTQGDAILTASRGRQYENTQVEAGDIVLNLDNHTGVFTPGNPSSPYYPNLQLNVPTRVTAIWNSKQYPVCHGYVERWPQTYPDPQWGITPMEAADIIGPLSNINLPSALQGEVLLDSPYVYCPCSENYSEANGLPANNISRVNQRPATYMDAIISYSPSSLRQMQTGLALNMLGDMGTGVGYGSVSGGADVTPMPGTFYTDPNLATIMSGPNGLTIGFWMVIGNNRNSNTSMEVFRLAGNTPNYYYATQFLGGFGTRFLVFLNGNSQITAEVADFHGNSQSYNWTQSPADGLLHFYAFTITSTSPGSFTFTGYLDGVQKFSNIVSSLTSNTNDVWWMSWGPQMYTNGGNGEGNNYAIGHVTLFPAVLPYTRIAKHYNTGFTGATGDSANTRFGKLLAWGNYGGGRAGATGSPSPQFGPADQIQQTSIASAIDTIAKTDQGMFFADASGNATYWSRQFLYNRPVKWVFSDAQPQQLNINSSFDTGLGPWTSINSTLTLTAAQAHSGQYAMKITPTGGFSTAGAQSETFTVSPSTTYQVNAWGISVPGYGNFQILVNWYTSGAVFISSATQTISLPAGVWELNSQTFTSPSNAGQANFQVLETGTPSSGAVFSVDGAQFLTVPNAAPYDPASQFDYDNSFVYNLVQSERTVSGGNLDSSGRWNPVTKSWTTSGYGALAIQWDPTSTNQYFPRGPLELDVETNSDQDAFDVVNWNLVAYKQPMLRVASLVLTPSANPTLWSTALAVEQGDVAQVMRSPLGGYAINQNVIIQAVKHEVDADNWVTTIEATPYFPGGNVLQCDVSGYNVLGQNAIAW